MGSFSIELESEPLANMESRTATALLIYLLAHQQPISRETLADFFWDDRTQKQAAANLRATLSRLRKRLGDFLVVTRQTVGFNHQQGGYWVDAFAIEDALQQQLVQDQPDIATLEQAIEWYKGDFLAGFYLNESRGFEEWMVVQRERLRGLAIQAFDCVVAYHLDAGRYALTLGYAQQWVGLDPLDEAAHRQLMKLQMRNGQRNAALKQYQECRELLLEELGVEPDPRTTALFERFQTLSSPPPLQVPDLNTPFVGRDLELAQIIRRFDARRYTLLTILGPGGMGKTTLAIESARRLAQQPLTSFLDGVFYVPLAGLPSSNLLAVAIATTLGLNPPNELDPESYLRDYLSDREVLLVLDNFEHLLGNRSQDALKRLMEASPGLRVIVTSRRRLGLTTEHVIELNGLTYPDSADADDPTSYEAVQLFMHHAKRLRPGFSTTEEGMTAIVDVCHLVQGMPMGLELAASWTRMYDCVTIRDRIKENIDLLDARQPDEQGRPRSMRATFDYTWSSLLPEARSAMRKMAVFSGPFKIAAAEYVAEAWPALLKNLVDRSLLRSDDVDLWSLHSLFRQYCGEELARYESDRESALKRHSEHYQQLVREAAGTLRKARSMGQRADIAKQQVRGEIDNVRAVWERLCANPELIASEKRIQFVDDFGLYLFLESWYQEAAMLYTEALTDTQLEQIVVGRWQRELGRAYLGLGQAEKANTLFVQALSSLDQPTPDQQRNLQIALLGQILQQTRFRLSKRARPTDEQDKPSANEAIQVYDRLSRTYYYAGQPRDFGYCALRSLNLAEQTNNQEARARGYANLCLGLGFLRRHSWAQSYLEQAHTIAANLHDAPSVAYVHLVTGVYDGMMGIWQRSNNSLKQATQIYEQLGDMQQWGEGFSVNCTNLYAQGKFQETVEQRLILTETAREVGNPLHEAWGLSGLAAALLVLDQTDEAITLLQRSTDRLKSLNSPQNVLSAQALLGQAYLRKRNWQKAIELANSVLEMKDKTEPTFATNVAVFESVCIIYLGLLDLSPQRLSSLGVDSAYLLDKIDHSSAALTRFAKIARMGMPRALYYRGHYLWRRGKQRQALAHWRQSVAVAEQLSMPYDHARASYELARHLDSGEPERAGAYRSAAQGFELTGAAYELRLLKQS